MKTTMFSWDQFKKFYFASSTYAKKQALARDFHAVWFDAVSSVDSLGGCPTWGAVKRLFNAANKKKMKTLLLARGYTSAAIDGLFKCLSMWLAANS